MELVRFSPKSIFRAAATAFLFLALTGINACKEDIVLDPAQKTTTTTSTTTTSTEEDSTTTTTVTTDETTSSTTTEETSDTTDPTAETSEGSDSGTILIPTDNFLSEIDSDDDGLNDEAEKAQNLDPLNPDTDGDGLSDGYESKAGFSPLDSQDAQHLELRAPQSALTFVTELDTDGDGLPDSFETQFGTDPSRWDADFDSYSDGVELLNGSAPNLFTTLSTDTDNDGLSDIAEERWGTSVTSADSDRDLLSDPFELLFVTSPSNPDSDDDGVLDGWDAHPGTYRYSFITWMSAD